MKALTALLLAVFAVESIYSQAERLHYVDVASEWGITAQNVFGGAATKQYILETTGTGVAIVDYDADGHNDVLLVNGTTLEGNSRPALSHLYRNDGKGRFADVTAEAFPAREGWGQSVCAGDFDNDGRVDLLVTYYGYNSLYRNEASGKFTEITRE